MPNAAMIGVPVLDERSRRITIFGGKLRTASPEKFVVIKNNNFIRISFKATHKGMKAG